MSVYTSNQSNTDKSATDWLLNAEAWPSYLRGREASLYLSLMVMAWDGRLTLSADKETSLLVGESCATD